MVINMMNNRGQNLLLALLTAVMIFVAGMLIMNHVLDDISLTRTVGLDCSNPNISDGTKVTCLGVNIIAPLLIIVIVSLALSAILSRFII